MKTQLMMWKASLSSRARTAGVFYVLSFVTALLAEAFVKGKILQVAGLVPVLCFGVVTLLLYGIFKPVSRTASFLAASANLAGLTFEGFEFQPGGVNVALVLHGIFCLLIAQLVSKSTFLPRIFGLSMAVAGLGWLTGQLPQVTAGMRLYTQVAGFLGEGLFMLWLIAKGVNAAKWNNAAN